MTKTVTETIERFSNRCRAHRSSRRSWLPGSPWPPGAPARSRTELFAPSFCDPYRGTSLLRKRHPAGLTVGPCLGSEGDPREVGLFAGKPLATRCAWKVADGVTHTHVHTHTHAYTHTHTHTHTQVHTHRYTHTVIIWTVFLLPVPRIGHFWRERTRSRYEVDLQGYLAHKNPPPP